MSVPQSRTLRDLQRKSISVLKAAGYVCTSLPEATVFNIVAFCSSDIVLIQLAVNDWPNDDKLKAIKKFPAPRNTKKLVHLWTSYARTPQVMEVK